MPPPPPPVRTQPATYCFACLWKILIVSGQLLLALCMALPAGALWAAAATDDAPAGTRIEIPADEGRVNVRELLRQVYVALDIEAPDGLDELRWTVDVDSAVGRAQLESLRRRTDGLLAAAVEDGRVVLRTGCAAPADLTKEDRVDIESRLNRLTASLRLQRQPLYGITFVTEDEPRMIPARFARSRETMPPRIVLLVHGLDDPGWMWRDVSVALRQAGHVVARLDYPNDGPIADAADLLMQSLMELKARGVERVDIVAHSMGGLVARDVLTRRAYYACRGAGDDACPAIDRLIMCGTPNHGSTMARLRAIAGIGEQISRAFSENGSSTMGQSDGSGEAAVDLMPGSEFLHHLNRRPLAAHTAHTIIAGRISPVTEGQLAALSRKIKESARAASAPRWLRDWLASADEETSAFLKEAVRGLGDGCVTIDSARLAGVNDFVILEANHVSLIVNLVESSDSTPPAIPIILDRLGKPGESEERPAGDR